MEQINNKQAIAMEKSKPVGRWRARAPPQQGKQSQRGLPTSSQSFDSNLYEKFVRFLSRTRLQKLKEKVTYFYGRNFPIAYQQKFNFAEEWQGGERREEKNLYERIQAESVLVRFACLFLMLTNTFLVWECTVERFFRAPGEDSTLFLPTMALGVLNRVVAAALNLYLQFISADNTLAPRKAVRIITKDLLCALYFLVSFCDAFYGSAVVVGAEVVIEVHLYLQARQYYKYFRIIELSLIYEYQFKILDLMINLFVLTHCLSLLLFLGTFFDPEKNWVAAMGAAHETFLGKYLYSLYFCSTTILTIGYGDITPKNKLEIVIVIVIEFFGVIIFGYLINEIGHTLSVIRTNEENLQKDLTTLRKIENFYRLDSGLSNRAKGYLVANQNATAELTPDEENTLLSKLNEDLRSNIINERSLSIVKSSIFFLCRWSKDMQTHVASKLQRALYAPNERLLQPAGKERIYIIKRGKVDVYCDRFGHNRKEDRRLLKTIRASGGDTISDNIYGYTAVISLRTSALDAVSSEFTSCFFLDREAFLKCVNNNQVDLEYFHEIKSRIDQSEFCESYEAPSMLNIREHYNPSRTVLIRKTRAQLAKLSNPREPYIRAHRRNVQKHYFKNLDKMIEDINNKLMLDDFAEETARKCDLSSDSAIDVRKCSEKEIEEEVIRGGTIMPIARKKTNTIIRTNDFINMTSFNTEKSDILMPIIKKAFHHYFERGQEYRNFFCSNNLTEVLKSLENENYNHNKKEDHFLSIKMLTHTSINFGFRDKSHK